MINRPNFNLLNLNPSKSPLIKGRLTTNLISHGIRAVPLLIKGRLGGVIKKLVKTEGKTWKIAKK